MRSIPKKAPKKQKKLVAVSGGFDPLHIGHVRLFKEARALGDSLVVILNNDHWLRNKKGFVFMKEEERMEIIRSFPFVDRVVLTDHKPNDTDRSIVHVLKKLRPSIFANGGDRDKKDARSASSSLNPEQRFCEEQGITLVYGVGRGGKIQSSSWMVRDAVRGFARSVRPWGAFYDWDGSDTWHLKTLVVNPGMTLGLQYHRHRSERWILVEGDATAITVIKGTQKKTKMKIGEVFAVPQGTMHRLTSKKGGTLIEVALGAFDENDIVRVANDHGRT